MKSQQRNLNPTLEARIAMWIWGKEYSEQRGGSMDFWDKLAPERQELVREIIKLVEEYV